MKKRQGERRGVMNIAYPFIKIALEDGELFTKCGPCCCGGVDPKCASCINADEIEAKGLDWETEYQKAISEAKGGK